VFGPFELVADAWESGRFDWRPEEDDERERELHDSGAVIGFAEGAACAFRDFMCRWGAELGRSDPCIWTPRGEIAFSSLLGFQRWHVAYHYRQLVEFLRAEGASPQAVFPLGRLAGLMLPADVY
jgi:hypothetical protein